MAMEIDLDSVAHSGGRKRRRRENRHLFQRHAHILLPSLHHPSDRTGIAGRFHLGLGGRRGLGHASDFEAAAAVLSRRDARRAGAISFWPDVKFIRAHWELNKWGRGAPLPVFEMGLHLAEIPAMNLRAQVEAFK